MCHQNLKRNLNRSITIEKESKLYDNVYNNNVSSDSSGYMSSSESGQVKIYSGQIRKRKIGLAMVNSTAITE